MIQNKRKERNIMSNYEVSLSNKINENIMH